ncbi:gag-pol polyprotein [Tanacetum coccineum]
MRDADLSKNKSSPKSPLEFQRSWYVEGHVRSRVISSVLAQWYLRTIRQRYSPREGPQSLLGDEGLSSRGNKLNSIFITAEKKADEGMVESQPMEKEFLGAGTRDAGTETRGGPTKPVLQKQKTPSPSPSFIKENIDVLRTMIKEHDQQAKTKATPRKLAYANSDKEGPAKSLARGFSDRLSLESSGTSDTHRQTHYASKSKRTPSKNKEPTHLRRSRRLEDRNITKEKARKEKSKSRRKRSGHQETSLDSEHEEVNTRSRGLGEVGLSSKGHLPEQPMKWELGKELRKEGIIEGDQVRRILVDGGSSSEIMYEHCFRNLNVNIRSRLRRKDQNEKARSSRFTIHSMIKFPTNQGVVTMETSREDIRECKHLERVQGPDSGPVSPKKMGQRRRRGDILRENIEVFTWTGLEKIVVPQFVMEHHLKIYPLSKPVIHKRQPMAPEGRLALKEKVFRWLKEGLIGKEGEELASLMGYRYKCFLRLSKEYNQIRMAEDDEEKTGYALEDNREVQDVEDTLRKLKRVNIKIDPVTSSFGVKEGWFLGCMVTKEGVKADPEKIQEIILGPSPRSPNQIRSLFLQLTAISKFTPKLVELKYPIRKARMRLETVKESGWTNKAEEALRRIKRKLGTLQTLAILKEGEDLMLCLRKRNETISFMLLVEREGIQIPVSYVKVVNDRPMEEMLKFSGKEERLAKWAAEIQTYDISYIPGKEAEGPVVKKFFSQGEQVQETLDKNEGRTLNLNKELQIKSTLTPRAWRLYLGKETIEEDLGVGIILVNPEERMHLYAIPLKFNTSDHAIDCEALLAGLAVSVSKGMKDLDVFIDSPRLVAQTEGNHTPATEQKKKYKKEIMDATPSFHRFRITHLQKILNSKAEVLTRLATIKLQFLNQEVSVGIKTRPSVEETSSSKKGKATSNVSSAKPNYNWEVSGSN